MHEFSIMENLFTIIEQQAEQNNLHKINVIVLQIGHLRQVIPEFLEFAFNTIAKDTIAAGAKLQIEQIPIKIFCDNCQQEFLISDPTYVCPKCTSTNITITAGKEIVLASIEGDQ